MFKVSVIGFDLQRLDRRACVSWSGGDKQVGQSLRPFELISSTDSCL